MSGDEETEHFSVVIAADGSAAIDGVPVRVVEGESVDSAVLDALHGYARDRDAAVTAAISDPAVQQVTFVEVAPDGSSRLVERPYEAVGVETGHGAPASRPEGPGPAPHGRTPEAEPPSGAPRLDDVDDDDGPYATWPSSGRKSVRGPLLRRPQPEAGNTSRQSDDEYRASGLLHRPLVVGTVALGVAALVVVPLVLLGSGGSGGGQNKAAGANVELSESPPDHGPRLTSTPTVSVSPSLSSLSPSTSPTGTDSSATSGNATATPKPAADTAATAVNRLARNGPGRHVCYRAYVSGQGWQKPVCDGGVAGTSGRTGSIMALDLAVRGTGGVSANAFVYKPGSTDGKGVWMPKWTPNTGDGQDIYIGHAGTNAPHMLGFAISIGSGGKVCQSARVHNSDWKQWGCVGPQPEYIFGGTLTNDVWLEAVKFTV
ncbi:hypothetical protein AB0M29_17925 [Streptomyces sp. NPDC051976]|uniref:hypothetical protein n=1 Tax=Streptomyces sp. NPDC051976 TaxID=3154947 RepID=UPI0034282B7B